MARRLAGLASHLHPRPHRASGTGLGGGQPDSGQPFQRELLDAGQARVLADATAQVQDQGWAMLPGIIPADELPGVRESTLATLASTDPEVQDRRTGSWVSVDESIWPYMAHPLVLGVAENIWRTTYVKVLVTTPITRFPREDGSPLPRDSRGHHSDWPYNTHEHPVFIPEPYDTGPDPLMLTVIFMLSPFTVENATVLVPRSHKLGFNYLSAHDAPTNHTESNELPEPLPEPLAQARAVGPEGGVIIFDSRLWVSAQLRRDLRNSKEARDAQHGAPLHTSMEARVGVTIRFAPWWFNHLPLLPGSPEREAMLANGVPEGNNVKHLPRETWERMPPAAQKLLEVWVQ